MKPAVFCLMGPTAAGKTALSLALADYFPIDIINVDSAQVYRGMDVGTGKPTLKERQQVRHHLIDILDPSESYSVAQFLVDAHKAIASIVASGRIPLLVGGTMLYFKALQQGLSLLPSTPPALRAHSQQQYQAQGLAALYAQLQAVDPITAARLSPTDPQRIMRALEVFTLSQKPLSTWLTAPVAAPCDYRFINLALTPKTTPRSVLHERISLRFQTMLNEGFLDEVKTLYHRGDLQPCLPALRAVGYRQGWEYLTDSSSSFSAFQEKSIAATRQLAKRQLTWLRQWNCLTELDFACPLREQNARAWIENNLSCHTLQSFS